jgi:hypothetical protein
VSIRYIDGNNNAYTIDPDRVAYEPVPMARSSSGMYSGGEPKSAAITTEQHRAIVALFERIIADSAIHLASRPKGCGTVICDGTRVYFQAPIKQELETALQAALSGA